MSDSQSETKNATSTNTELTTKNLNVSGNTGLTAVGGEGGSLDLSYNPTTTSIDAHTETDFGAIKAGTALSQHALDVAASVNGSAIDAVQNLASKSLTATGNAYGAALNAVQDNTDNTVTVISTLAGKFGTALQGLFEDTQTQLGNTVSALNSTYTANNTSANQQVINATSAAEKSVIDAVKYLALAVVAGVAVYYITKKG